jgi:hypothetical protein
MGCLHHSNCCGLEPVTIRAMHTATSGNMLIGSIPDIPLPSVLASGMILRIALGSKAGKCRGFGDPDRIAMNCGQTYLH